MSDAVNSSAPPSPSAATPLLLDAGRVLDKQVVIQSLHPFFIEVDGIRIAIPASREAVAHFKPQDAPCVTISPSAITPSSEYQERGSSLTWISRNWKKAVLGVIVVGVIGYGINKTLLESE